MSIALTKTLQTVEYDLHIVTELVLANQSMVVGKLSVYESVGHFTDTFLPIIQRFENITDAGVIATVETNKYTAYTVAIDAIEDWLVAEVAWYATGVVS